MVVLAVGVDDVRDELRTLVDEEATTPQEIARRTFGTRIDVRHRKHAAAQQAGYFCGVAAIVLHFAAVDRFHVERMSEREGDRFVFTQIGEPIPGEHAFAADDQALAKRRHGVEEHLGVGGQIAGEDGGAAVVEDVGEHAPGVQIDAAVECVGLVVKTHDDLLESPRGMSRVEPASWLSADTCRLKDPRRTALRR